MFYLFLFIFTIFDINKNPKAKKKVYYSGKNL